jgi:hypothetical protein
MTRFAPRICAIILLLAAVSMVGCSKSPFDLAPVYGKVTIDGKPVSTGRVMFAPIAKGESREVGKPAFGTLQADGTFTLTTFEEGDGAVVGEHWVTIFGPDEETIVTPVSTTGVPKFSRLSVPQKQKVAGNQENQIEVNLTLQDVAKFGKP